MKNERHEFPLQLFALAYSRQGEALLRRFDFSILQAAKQTKDGFPSYYARYATREEIVEALAGRGLTLEFANE